MNRWIAYRKHRGLLCLIVLGGCLIGGNLAGESWALERIKKTRGANGLPSLIPDVSSTPKVLPKGRYQPGSRRDPFVPLRGKEPKQGRAIPLPLTSNPGKGEFIVLGIVVGRSGAAAVLQRPDGGRILVKLGSELKADHARVVGISQDGVSLEYQIEENGNTQVLKRRISLPNSATMGPASPG